jgi:hypothetical protein
MMMRGVNGKNRREREGEGESKEEFSVISFSIFPFFSALVNPPSSS